MVCTSITFELRANIFNYSQIIAFMFHQLKKAHLIQNIKNQYGRNMIW